MRFKRQFGEWAYSENQLCSVGGRANAIFFEGSETKDINEYVQPKDPGPWFKRDCLNDRGFG